MQAIPNVNVQDLHLQGGKLVVKEQASLYDTTKPRQMLLEVLEKRIEAQRLIGLKNIQGEESDLDQGGDRDDVEFDDFMELYFEGSD